MEGIEYIYELCEALPRSGPGENKHTKRAFNSIPQLPNQPFILDIGCGQGMQTLEIARMTDGKIIALDNHQGFLDILYKDAKKQGLEEKIILCNMSMLDMDFERETFDLIWSEGALYLLGFQDGLKRCHQLLKKKGYLAVTELIYTRPHTPNDVVEFFNSEYPDIKSIAENIELIEKQGFNLISHFTLPESAWMEDYYTPIEKELPRLNKKYEGNEVALSIFEGFSHEVDFYKKYSKFYGYEFFIMQKNKVTNHFI
jgi:ubiquinone/menaquinone biosynthesis C-methylase UbiE